MAKDIMDRHGQKFDAYYRVIMPDTWTPVFDLTDRNRVDKWLSDGKNQLELVIDNIMSKRKGDFIDGYPVWKLEECEMCLGCLYRCPKFAISYGNGKLTDMDSIKIHILEFKRKHRISGERNSKS